MPKNYVKLYWIVWGLVAAATVAGWFVFRGSAGRTLLLYTVFGWLPLGFVSRFERGRFIHFLRSGHPSEWNELASEDGGAVKDIRFYRFIFKRGASEDPVLSQFKAINREIIFLIFGTLLVTCALYILTRIR